MLTQIDVIYGNELGEQALALPILGVTPKESLLVRTVTGLDAPGRDLFIGEYARDGGNYQGSRVGNRNVVLTIDLNPNPALGESISGLRSLLYKTFMDPLVDADHVELVLHDDDSQIRNLYGYCEKLESEIFGIETMAQVSLLCPDPYIRDLVETVLTNPTGTWVSVPFTYGGTAETGFEVQIQMTADHPTLVLWNNTKYMVLENGTNLLGGVDVIYINTNRGSRDIRKATLTQVNAVKTAHPTWTLTQVWAELVATNTAVPMIAKLRSDSTWLELHSQANTMRVQGSAPTDLIAGVKTLTYRQAYWGV